MVFRYSFFAFAHKIFDFVSESLAARLSFALLTFADQERSSGYRNGVPGQRSGRPELALLLVLTDALRFFKLTSNLKPD